jgi:hypothetical protein
MLEELELFLQRFKLSHRLWDNSLLCDKYVSIQYAFNTFFKISNP